MAGEEHYCDGRRRNLTALPGWELQRQRGKRFKSCTQNSKYDLLYFYCISPTVHGFRAPTTLFTWWFINAHYSCSEPKVTSSNCLFLLYLTGRILFLLWWFISNNKFMLKSAAGVDDVKSCGVKKLTAKQSAELRVPVQRAWSVTRNRSLNVTTCAYFSWAQFGGRNVLNADT